MCRGEARWNGVAILVRWAPVVTCVDLPDDDADGQCRYLEAAVNGVLVASIYAPKGSPQPGPKFDYKLAWLKRLATEAWLGDILLDGTIGNRRRVAGGPDESAFQPERSPHGVSDRGSGWWNLYRAHDGAIEPMAEMDAEFG